MTIRIPLAGRTSWLGPRHRRVRLVALTMAIVSTPAVEVSLASSAVADSAGNLRTAVMSLRQGSCSALRSDSLVEQAAENVIQSTDAWVDHTARAVPVPDVVPVLKDLGYAGNKATMLVSAGHTDAEAIAGLLLQGYLSIRDCSYADYGASLRQNQTSGFYLATVVMAGV